MGLVSGHLEAGVNPCSPSQRPGGVGWKVNHPVTAARQTDKMMMVRHRPIAHTCRCPLRDTSSQRSLSYHSPPRDTNHCCPLYHTHSHHSLLPAIPSHHFQMPHFLSSRHHHHHHHLSIHNNSRLFHIHSHSCPLDILNLPAPVLSLLQPILSHH